MPKKEEIDIERRALIIAHHKNGKSNRKIGTEMNINHSTVDYIIKKYHESGTLINKKRSGRSQITKSQEDIAIVLISKRNRRKTAPEITAEINCTRSKSVSVSTVKRRLQKAGLHGRISMKKPLLSAQNRKKRLTWAREHQNWTLEDWKTVLWTDESKFIIFGSRRRAFVRRFSGERAKDYCISPTVKHGGGSVMIWGCFGGTNVGDLVKIDGILKKEQYKQILENHAIPSGLRILGPNFVFQQDNDPKHTSKICKEYLRQVEDEGIAKVMKWPPQSPDLNPIELLWDEVDREVRKAAPTSSSHMWITLQEAWSRITQESLEKLLKRMPRLCAAIIKNKGTHVDERKI